MSCQMNTTRQTFRMMRNKRPHCGGLPLFDCSMRCDGPTTWWWVKTERQEQ